ncbi:CBO0543 family protein [Metabacillus litoralis]|uniref:CBO0543 family protein n=1 Tax=Metabacillus litoralis TaxID=152268 RepID=UPI000EF62C09|nr:CBO0543 family protein [Metabacillus litoralis]
MDRISEFDQIVNERKNSTELLNSYWTEYSGPSTWQFWLLLLLFLLPLVVTYFKIDRNKAFEIGFYGYSIHILISLGDLYGINMGYWNYPYQIIPSLPSLSIDTSLVPVCYLFVYQFTLKNKTKFYLYSVLVSGIFAFVIKPIMVQTGFFKMYQNVNYIHLFLLYLLLFLAARFISYIFKRLNKETSK